MARNNLPEWPNTTFMVVICQVSNGNDIVQSRNQLKAWYTDVRYNEELIDFIDKNRCPEEPYILPSRFNCTLEQKELDKEYMGLYTNRQIKLNTIYGQIS